MNCSECAAQIQIPQDAIDGEIVSCDDCGSSFELEISEAGLLNLKPAEAIGEDWGE